MLRITHYEWQPELRTSPSAGSLSLTVHGDRKAIEALWFLIDGLAYLELSDRVHAPGAPKRASKKRRTK